MPALGGMRVASARIQLALDGWSWERTVVRLVSAGQDLPSGTVIATLPRPGEPMPADGPVILLVQR